MLNGKELKDEEKYLKTTIETIKDLLGNHIDSSNVQDKDIIKHRKFLWDNRNELDEIEINENCGQVALKEQMHSKKVSRIRTLERQLSSPYFARIDFREKGEDLESFYIGLSTVENEEDFEFLVFDWRSPISTMYYDFEVGKASYEAPGRIVEGEIEFNRQFNIRNGEIVFMHNSNESLCDQALNEMLGGNASDKMKNIVATIQKEQNEIIRNEDSKVLFIQGAAGSGKTSIALHRAAYILYKHRKELTADNVLIFSPNEVFAEYISEVLPDLGESNIGQTTFEIYAKKFLPSNYIYESKNEHLDYIYSEKKDMAIREKAMEFKNTKEFMDILNSFIEDIPKLLVNPAAIIIDGNEIINKKSVTKTFVDRFKDIPLLNRLEVIKQSLFSQVESKFLASDDAFEYVEDKNTFFEYCKEQINLQVDNMINTFDSVSIYKILWENINNYTNKDVTSISELTLDHISFGEVKFEDITPIIYIRAAMEGFRNYSDVKHILIDEAQDYSPLFYEMIKRSFKDSAITIMGDLNQRLDNHSNVKDKEDITCLFNDIKIAILKKSYRSTYDITSFTKELLTFGEPIEAVERKGELPTIYEVLYNKEEKINSIITTLKDKGFNSLAVICKNKAASEKLYEKLKSINKDINLIGDDSSLFKAGVNIIPSYLAKGLEFDCVIVADGEEYLTESYNNLFYTVCTRAMHELHIITNTSLNKILPKDPNLFQVK